MTFSENPIPEIQEIPGDAAMDESGGGDMAPPPEAGADGGERRPEILIRPAEFRDVPAIVKMAQNFFVQGEHWGPPVHLDRPMLAEHLVALIENPHAQLATLTCEVGGVPAGFLALCLLWDMHEGGYAALKMHWVMDERFKGHGLKLIRAGEKWARTKGAKKLIIAAMHGRAEKLLETLGFEKLETSYIRMLK